MNDVEIKSVLQENTKERKVGYDQATSEQLGEFDIAFQLVSNGDDSSVSLLSNFAGKSKLEMLTCITSKFYAALASLEETMQLPFVDAMAFVIIKHSEEDEEDEEEDVDNE